MNPILAIIVSLLLASAAHGGVLTGAAKVAGKIAERGTDNAVEHVATHNGDDAARAAVKGGGEVAVRAAPKVVQTVDAAVDAARLETRAAKPAVETIHRAPIVKPGHLVGGGVGAAAVVGVDNYTAGEREIDEAVRDAIGRDPALARERINESGRWKTTLAACGGAAIVLIGLAFALRIAPPLRGRGRKQPAAAAATSEKTA